MENKFLDAMRFRFACKEFDASKKISKEDFDAILEMGRLSPSSFGFEPWKFVIVQNKELREKIRLFAWGAQGQAPTASHFMIILARKKKDMIYSGDYIKHMMRDVKKFPKDVEELYGGFVEKFQKKDFNLMQSERAFFDWACKQAYIPLANMMSGAAYMDIDSCPMEGFDYKSAEKFVKEELNIDTDSFGPAVMVAFGYRKEAPKREKTRQKLEDITIWYD